MQHGYFKDCKCYSSVEGFNFFLFLCIFEFSSGYMGNMGQPIGWLSLCPSISLAGQSWDWEIDEFSYSALYTGPIHRVI